MAPLRLWAISQSRIEMGDQLDGVVVSPLSLYSTSCSQVAMQVHASKARFSSARSKHMGSNMCASWTWSDVACFQHDSFWLDRAADGYKPKIYSVRVQELFVLIFFLDTICLTSWARVTQCQGLLPTTAMMHLYPRTMAASIFPAPPTPTNARNLWT